jgi:CRP-like cAMP-binding protein
MSLDGDISLLKRVALFADLPGEQLRLIAFSAVRLELVPGQVLFRGGAKAGSGYIVSSGRVELVQETDGKRETVALCEAGSLIGEIALFIETRRPATAVAAVASQVLEVDRKLVTRMLNEYPDIALRLRATLSDRLTATVSELTRVRQRLMSIDRLQPRRSGPP